ncbi:MULTISPECIES: cold-shock protein [Gillisia]|uniref:Cold shock domain-containing protein n=1 Tax=Gillisia hiemivivida TaxID=291190 RepID=A0A5C6ZVU9_9FLAO|nr:MULTISPECIES: cold shock domain-containing protein [Gillisia]TXD94070.1 cold shock domain-containing protein [Gillisia hiemivivida]
MARPQESFGKKEKEKKRLKKREEKQRKKDERKSSAKSGDLEDMLVYVDENGQLTDTPPDPTKKVKIDAESIVIGVPKKEYIEEDPFHKGKVEFFNDSKGFGFINDLDSQEKYFVHISELVDEVKEGDNVIFEIERGMKGMNAVRVKKG